MVKTYWFCKVGRTTNVTAGICNVIKADVPITNWKVFCTEEGDKAEVKWPTVRHWVVMNRYKRNNETHGAEFAAKGDFGAFVIDEDGAVAGFLYGLCSNYSYGNGGMGLVSCMSEVLPTIERRRSVKNENGDDVKGELTLAYRGSSASQKVLV